MKVLIVSSGSIKNCEILKKEIENNDYVICADGGLDHLMKIDKKPDLLVGDLDSLSLSGKQYIAEKDIEVMKFPTKKNMTDSELAVEFAKKNNATDITLIGSTGSRLDHSIANIFMLRKLNLMGIKSKVVDDNNSIVYSRDYIEVLKDSDKKYLSVLPISLEGATVTLEGLVYPLDKYHIDYSSTIGISNEIYEDTAIIKIHNGEVLIIQSKD